jgi:hypothetical protein
MNQLSNRFKYCVMKKAIDMSTDTLKIALMGPAFAYSQSSHNVYADISANELGTAGGYTAGGSACSGQVVSQDDANFAGKVVLTHAGWTATAAGIGPAIGAIIYDDSVAGATGIGTDPIIGYVDFGGSQSVAEGGVFKLSEIVLMLT